MADSAHIRRAQASDREALVEMRVALWPESSSEEQRAEVDAWLGHDAGSTLPLTILVAEDSSGAVTGFTRGGPAVARRWMRHRASGGLCGRLVRLRSVARARTGREWIRAAEEWARAEGAVEMASDALIDNLGSQDAHRALGFEEVDRCVHLRKRL